MKNRAFLILLALSVAFTANARQAKKGIITLTQPDGSTLNVTMVGDEFQHIMKTTDGCAIVQDEDGWYSYARFNSSGERFSTRSHVGKSVSSSVISASRSIPVAAISALADRRRNAAGPMGKSIFRRMGATVTKAGSTNVKHGIVILAQYSDVKFTHTRAEFVNMLTQKGYSVNGATGCAKDYFEDQFHGLYDFSFDVTEIVTLPNSRSYYGRNDSSGNDKNPDGMIVDACKLVDSSVDFSLYDDDGDGEVDNVFLFFAGGDEAEYAGDDCIWSHAWYIKDGAGQNVVLDGKVINRYACTSECTTEDYRTFKKMATIGTFCHEYSHTFGLPDFYDTDYGEANGYSDGLWGSPSLMDAGNENNGGNTPPYYNAIERELLGIGDAQKFPNGNVTLEPIYKNGTYYVIQSRKDGEYFMFECRDNTGWDAYIGGRGLLVYHIDRSTTPVSVSLDNRTCTVPAIELWDIYNMVNAKSSHPCADIIEANPSANGKHSSRTNGSCVDIFYPYGSYKSITPSTTQKLKTWDGTVLDVTINNIAVSGSNVTMTVIGDTSVEVPPTPVNITKFISTDAIIVNFESSRSFEGDARVCYGQSGKGSKTEILVKPYAPGKYAFRLEGLSAKTSYEVVLSFFVEDLDGEQVTTTFMTSSVSQYGYPYIYLKGLRRNENGSFPTGCKLPLLVGGASDVSHVEWYFNEQSVHPGENCWFTPSGSGHLKAKITYADGSHDVLVKYIEIK